MDKGPREVDEAEKTRNPKAQETWAMIVPFPNSDPELVAVGGRLHAAREARGVGLEALARAMHVEPDRLRRAEVGRERLKGSELYAAILALHLPVDVLFRDRGGPAGRG